MSAHVLPAGTCLDEDHYETEHCLGQGSFGITYRAHDMSLRRTVALKEFFPQGCQRVKGRLTRGGDWTDADLEGFKARFVEEGRILARLRHPGIVQVYDIFRENATAYIAMEFVSGQTLRDYQMARGDMVLDPEEALWIIRQAGEALCVVHAAGLLHRDVKPGNIMRCDDGRIVLIDFGAAREFSPDLEMSQTIIYTPGYAPLEQYSRQGKRGEFTDVYGLAGTLYNLLTGQRPIDATDRMVGIALPSPQDLCPAVPAPVAEAVMAGLAMAWDRRPPTVRAFLDLLPATPTSVCFPGAISSPQSGPPPSAQQTFPSDAGRTGEPFSTAPHTRSASEEFPESHAWMSSPDLREMQGPISVRPFVPVEAPERSDTPILHGDITLQGRQQGIWAIAWSSEGDRLAAGGGDPGITLWDVGHQRIERIIKGHTNTVVALDWHPQDERLVSGSWDGAVRLWDTLSGRILHTLSGHKSQVETVAWDPGGGRVASGGWDNEIRFWDVEAGTTGQVLQGHTDWVFHVAWSPDGKRLVSVSQDRSGRIWDCQTGATERVLTGSRHSLVSVAWSPDGERIAAGGLNGAVRVWNARTGAEEWLLNGHTASVWSVAWHPNGRWLATGSGDKTVRVWDIQTGQTLYKASAHTKYVMSVAWNREGRLASASRDNTLRIWQMDP